MADWIRTFSAILAAVTLAATVAAETPQAITRQAGAPPLSASQADVGTWQKHEYSFSFLGFTTTYSCDGLAGKLKLLLLAAGARADAKSTAGACASDYARPDRFARANLSFYTLAPGGDGNIPGIWRAVAFTTTTPRELAVGDCELIEQFTSEVLPMFTTRGLEKHTTCIPHQDSGSVVDLKFDVLTAPAPKKIG